MSWASEIAKPQYLQLMTRAAQEPKIFTCFKSMPIFQRVVGITEDLYARECYKQIQENPDVFKNMSKFALNDISTPYLSLARIQRQTEDGTMVSKQLGTDTIRFAHTVHLLQKTFGSLNNKTVLEWGSNYGGLCHAILQQWPEVKKYHVVDLIEVQQLCLKYLQSLNVDMNKVSTELEPPDIFIAELSLSEMDDDTVFAEYDKYAKNAAGMLMRINFPEDIRRNNFIDYIKQDFTVTVTQEHAIRANNYIVIGQKQ